MQHLLNDYFENYIIYQLTNLKGLNKSTYYYLNYLQTKLSLIMYRSVNLIRPRRKNPVILCINFNINAVINHFK